MIAWYRTYVDISKVVNFERRTNSLVGDYDGLGLVGRDEARGLSTGRMSGELRCGDEDPRPAGELVRDEN